MRKISSAILLPAAASAILTLSGLLYLKSEPAASARGGIVPVPASQPNLRITNDVRVYQAVKDAVVNISTTKLVTARVGTGDPFFDQFMGGGGFRQVPAQSLGSGFVIHPSGYIITNEHVVEEGTDVSVVFCNGDKLPARIIATDDEHDLAVIKVDPRQPLQAIALGSSEDLMIGEPVYAIGNPFGYAGTMTRGIISALDRTLDASPTKSYKGLIQTDASINPGNSGGPLLNAYGQVIGINTAIRANAQGIGFAIAVSNMRDLLPAFVNPEVLNKAQIGFTVEEHRTTKPPATISAAVFIKSVQPGSDADKAGLKVGDEILSISGAKVTGVVDALVAMSDAKPGENLLLSIARGSKADSLRVAVASLPPSPSEEILISKMGIKGETVTPVLQNRYKLAVGRGVYINSVLENTPAARAGLRPGDILVQLGRYYINSSDDVATLLKTVKDPVDARIGIVRGTARGGGTISLK